MVIKDMQLNKDEFDLLRKSIIKTNIPKGTWLNLDLAWVS